MRMPGLGGEVLKRAGGTPVSLPGGEIFTSLQTGNIDATEWVGPYNDIAFGFHRVAKYYYYPGWHEPGPLLEAMINRDAWASLPEDLQALVRTCCQAANCDMLAEYSYRNAEALRTLREDPDVDVRPFPESVLRELKRHTTTSSPRSRRATRTRRPSTNRSRPTRRAPRRGSRSARAPRSQRARSSQAARKVRLMRCGMRPSLSRAMRSTAW